MTEDATVGEHIHTTETSNALSRDFFPSNSNILLEHFNLLLEHFNLNTMSTTVATRHQSIASSRKRKYASNSASAQLPPVHPTLSSADDSASTHAPPNKRTRREVARVAAPSPGTKRCCKKDLKRCLRVGEILEVTRVDQHYLDEYNNGEKIRARFTGQNFFDLSKNTKYRSLSQWVKKRLVDVGALGVNSNISGWDFVAVERDGRKQALRMLVDNDNDASSRSSGSSTGSTPPTGVLVTNGAAMVERFFGGGTGTTGNTIAERMEQLCQRSESSTSASSSPTTSHSADEMEEHCQSLRDELSKARAYVGHIEQQLITNEKQLKSLRQNHEYDLRGRSTE